VETELIVELFDFVFQREVESFHFDELAEDFMVTCFEDFGLTDFLVHFLLLIFEFFHGLDEFLGVSVFFGQVFVFFGQGDRLFFVNGVKKFESVLDCFIQVFEEGTRSEVFLNVLLLEKVEAVVLVDVFREFLDDFHDSFLRVFGDLGL
jgi:hypothetical protein